MVVEGLCVRVSTCSESKSVPRGHDMKPSCMSGNTSVNHFGSLSIYYLVHCGIMGGVWGLGESLRFRIQVDILRVYGLCFRFLLSFRVKAF